MKMQVVRAAKVVARSRLFALLLLGATVLFLAGVAWG